MEWTDDAQRYPDPDHPLDRALRERGWPDVSAALTAPALALLLARNWQFDLLLSFFGDGQVSGPGFVINAVEDVTSNAGWVAFSGRAGRAERRAAFQDF